MNTRRMLTLAAFTAISLACGTSARAANIAFDAANDAAYDDGWQSGDNGGSGFGPWNLINFDGNGDSNINAGFFIGDSANNGAAPSGNINSLDVNNNGEAFGLFANTGDGASAERGFTGGPLLPGQTFSVSMDNGFIEGDGQVAFALLNASGLQRVTFGFAGGDSNYIVVDAAGAHDTGVPFTDDGLTVDVLLTGADSYSLLINGSPNHAGMLAESGDLTKFWLANLRAGPGSAHDAFFNHLAVGGTAIPEPATLVLAGLAALGLTYFTRRRN